MYVCVLGIPKGKFSKQMKKKKLSYRIIRIKRIFSGVYWCITWTKSLTKFVCEWIGPGYASINSGKNAFIPIIENWCRNTQSVRNKVIHKNYVFFVTSRSRTFRFGRNKELVLTNKQKQFCKKILFLRDTREKCFLRYREPATPGYFIAYCCIDTPRHEQYSSSQF